MDEFFLKKIFAVAIIIAYAVIISFALLYKKYNFVRIAPYLYSIAFVFYFENGLSDIILGILFFCFLTWIILYVNEKK
jgi:hypothetical protein